MSDVRFICKRCWQRPSLAETFYRCPECGRSKSSLDWLSPGDQDGLRPTADLLKGAGWNPVGGNRTVAQCPDHPESAVRLFCPCKEFLPPRSMLQRGDSMGLGFAGPQGSGKTVMISTMVHELQMVPGPDRNTPRVGLLGLGDTEISYEELARQLRAGIKPSLTQPEVQRLLEAPEEEVPRNFCWQIKLHGERKSRRRGFLAVYDVAGESWGETGERTLETFDRYLEICTSLVFLVDGAAVAQDLGIPAHDVWDQGARAGDRGAMDNQWLGRLVDRLQLQQTERSRLALVVSKADLIWSDPKWEVLKPMGAEEEQEQEEQEEQGGARAEARDETLAALLRESGRGQLLTMAQDEFQEVRAFASSSLGFTPTDDLVEDVNGQPPKLGAPPKPLGVVEPILWLLEGR